jgi:glutamate dehydrogenase
LRAPRQRRLPTEIEPLCEDRERRESIMYIEVDRADARTRSELLHELQRVLEAVRASVSDWKAMQQRMREDADRIEDEEGRALLHWFADGAMTLLGFEIERPRGESIERLGIFRLTG